MDSREVAEMVDRNHKDLLRDIRNYVGILEKSNERKIAPVDVPDWGAAGVPGDTSKMILVKS